MRKLVSIISPCYNGAKYLPAFLDSIVSQTYRPIELLFVDDGSNDNTKEVFESYRERLIQSNITPIYFFQENSGQASAINRALPHFEGDYMMWMDSDDILMPDNISKKVSYLEEHPEKGFVLCQGEIVHANDVSTSIGTLARKAQEPLDNLKLFEDLIMERNVVYVPATIMASRQAVLASIPTLHIYEGRQGQNWQLMLPLAFSNQYGLIEEPLFKYVIHEDSHSHANRTYIQSVARCNEFEKLISFTIDVIPKASKKEKEFWKKKCHVKYLKIKLQLAYQNIDKEHENTIRKELKENGEYSFQDSRLRYNIGKIKRMIVG